MTDQAMYHEPTLRERLVRRLGFRYHLGQTPDGADDLPGWMCTESRIHFSVADRVRLLLTGRLHIRLVQHTTQQVDSAKNRLDFYIQAPGDR